MHAALPTPTCLAEGRGGNRRGSGEGFPGAGPQKHPCSDCSPCHPSTPQLVAPQCCAGWSWEAWGACGGDTYREQWSGLQGTGGLHPPPTLALPWFVLQSLISSWKKEPKLLKWFLTSPHPLWRPPPQPQTLLAGRSQSGRRMPSSPCERLCSLPPPWQVTACSPSGPWALATPPHPSLPPLHTCVSMETPLCLLPGIP